MSTPTFRSMPLVRLVLLAGVSLLPVSARAAGESPAVGRHSVAPLAGVERHVHAAVTAADLAAEDEARAAAGQPYRFALPVDLALTPANAGSWEDLPGGRRLWRLRLASPGALSLNVGFGTCLLPPTALLHVYPAADSDRAVRLDPEGNAAHGQLWTPVLLTDEIVIELEVPQVDVPAVALEISQLGRGYRFFGEAGRDKAGSCNIDVVCGEGDAWRDQIDTVALIAIRGVRLCTGFMVNNTTEDGRPLFMTAFHCNLDADAAPSLVAYWNFQSPVCGQQSGGSLQQFSSGSTLLAAYEASDFTLVELDEAPPAAFGVKYAGWSRSTGAPTAGASIHHPSTDEKSISLENDPLTATAYGSNVALANGNHLRVADWDLGTTEPGSSGAPLFDPQQRVVGQLHGGEAACGNNESDWYGRFSSSWDGGGDSASRLREYLDPGETGAVTVDLFDPQDGRFAIVPAGAVVSERIDGGDFSPTRHVFGVSNVGTLPVTFSVTTTVAWLDLDTNGGFLAVGAQLEVVATLNALALELPSGRHTAAVVFTNPDTGVGDTRRTVTLLVRENTLSLRGAVPNPFTNVPVEIRYDLLAPARVRATVTDLRGLRVRDLGWFDGQDGTNIIPWDGRDDDGRLVPSGQYVIACEAVGQVVRRPVTFVH